MSYDRVWFCESLNRKFWSEYFELVDEGREAEAEHNWLRFHGDDLRFGVVLVAGRNCLIDELYLFLDEADARCFFEARPLKNGERGYRQREFVFDEGPVGFQERSLYINGERIECDM